VPEATTGTTAIPESVVLHVPLPIRSKVPASIPDLGRLEGIQALESKLDGV
jgi:hypothetical protein